MVHYLTTRGHQYTWRSALEDASAPPALREELLSRVRLLPYERLFRMRRLPAGTYVFADLDRLGVEATERAALVWRALRDNGVRVLNDPIRSMRRFELLRRLHARGLNAFNVYRLTDVGEVRRFPVFLRAEDGHEGPLTPLLHDAEELARAIDELAAEGLSRDNKLIVEYLDCRDASGLHHKVGVLFAGPHILQAARGVDAENWVVKAVPTGPGHPPLAASPRPDHRCLLHEVMQMAGIDYGRVDYAIVEDRVQVFEINTNPTVWPPDLLLRIARTLDEKRSTATIRVSETYVPAWKAIDTPAYYAGRVIHRALRRLGMMRYEDAVVRQLRNLKRRLTGSPTPRPPAVGRHQTGAARHPPG